LPDYTEVVFDAAAPPNTSRRRATVLLSLLLASGFAAALWAARALSTESVSYSNLLWHLFLAWIPFLIALLVYDRHRRGVSPWAVLAPAIAWLLFLPNAPYLLTDYFLLRWVDGAPVWFDVVLLTAFAWTGLLLGFVSLFLMHAVARALFGRLTSWMLVIGVLGLTSFGVYVGRFWRWNSWDAIVQPTHLLGDLAARLSDPVAMSKVAAATIILTGFLTLAYVVLYSFLRLAEEPR